MLLLASCEGRPLPGDDGGDGFGESGWADSGTTDTSELPDLSTDGSDSDDNGSAETGTAPCVDIVDSLVINDQTAPESVACVEQVLGDLTIGPTTALVDLSLLSNLREVGGTIYVFGNGSLTSLHGLELLTHTTHLHVRRNHQLADLRGLDSLSAVDRITVANNEGLTSVGGLPPNLAPSVLDIEDNDLLADLDGLPHFLPPAEQSILIEIKDNPALANLDGLSDCCATQPASLELAGNGALEDLRGLEGFTSLATLRLHSNVALGRLTGLDNLRAVQTFDIAYDHCTAGIYASLPDLVGAPMLETVDVLQIQWVGSLTSLDGLDHLGALSKLLIRNNAMLPYADVQALSNQASPAVEDTCGGIGGPECATEPCPMF